MTKRDKIYQKYGGLCGYTGKPLGSDWQIDHITSRIIFKERYSRIGVPQSELRAMVNNIDNLMPCCRIVNHYKRSLDLEQFRSYMLDFHKRLAKLPKRTTVPATARRIEYMNEVAGLFDITPDKPFSGKFYFETINQ